MELIRLENICKTYHLGEVDVPVLNGISFSIHQGELVALMGASGSGKSTLMNILGCLDRPSSGQYWLDGNEVGQLSSNERALVRTQKLGFVFQSFNLLGRTSAVNNVSMPLDYGLTAVSPAKAAERASELLTRVGLGHRLDHLSSQMSGGQQQRVAIARSLINRPALLLADEPTGNLDSHTSVEILQMFRELNATGITVLLVTHDQDVASYADRVIHIVDGVIDSDTKTDGAGSGRAHIAHGSGNSNGNGGIGNGNGHSNGNGYGNGHVSPAKVAGAAVASRQLVGAGVQTALLTDDPALWPAAEASPDASANFEATTVRPAPPQHRARPRRVVSSFVAALFPPTVRTAANALRRNKMRSALTTIGIIIGVGAVIAMVEIGQGSKTALMQTMATMGANNLIVQSGAAASGGVSWGVGSQKTLTPGDCDEIAKQCENVSAVAPMIQIRGQVVRNNKNWTPMTILGTTPDYLVVRDWNSMESGDMFTDQDVRGNVKDCVIGTTIARELFDEGESPIGKDIRVQNVALRVVGVLSKKGANMMGMDQDDIVLAPWTTIKFRVSGNNTGGSSGGTTASSAAAGASISTTTKTLNDLYPGTPGTTALYPQQSSTQTTNSPQRVMFINVDQILAKAGTAETIPTAINEITSLLHERHHIRADQSDDFNLRDMSEILNALGSTSRMMGGLLLIVAMISLVVGGVGIMNIMLVSVTERTKEIGLRMAVGARGHQILRQFLIEAVVLCLMGGAVGILLGRATATLVWYFLRWPITPSYLAIVGAFLVSATIGVGFGFYPAWKASRLDPIDALRYE
ncbi:MAG TPA: ABC transporter permease [Lacipirellulaceae bacterium]|jgi:ABC-type lipoprotein export system ATPase subunit/ABC-type antimicrobial peptide transport system permease subunit